MKIKLELLYIDNCQNYYKMLKNVEEAIQGLENEVEFEKILIEDEKTASKFNFLGSPTLLINGQDLFGNKAPAKISLACRFYPDGMPSPEEIRKAITSNLKKYI
mgnify:CR=1 FL=1